MRRLSYIIFLFFAFWGSPQSSICQNKQSQLFDTTLRSVNYKVVVSQHVGGTGRQDTFCAIGLQAIMQIIDSARRVYNVAADSLKYLRRDDPIQPTTGFGYHIINEDLVLVKSEATKKVDSLMALKFLSGTIYIKFSEGSSVRTIDAKNAASLKNGLEMTGPESIIVLDNCTYLNPDGTISRSVSKRIKL